MQGRLLYPGTTDSNPKGFNSIRVQSGAADLKVWVLHPDAGPALLYFGGNGEDLGADLPDFDTAFPGRAVYFMNYRSYGGSTGVPSERALIADAQVTYDLIAKTHTSVALMGRSLGTGVAVALATTRPVEKVILVTPFDSIANVAADRYRWAPVHWLIKDQYDSVKRMPHVRAPVLVIVAEHDESIPLVHTNALLAAIPEAQRHSVMIRGGTHNSLGDFQRYLAVVRDFLQGAPP
jgi:pimeloyl-ACP methyl ester carboxylesterase